MSLGTYPLWIKGADVYELIDDLIEIITDFQKNDNCLIASKRQCKTLFFWAPKSLQMVTTGMKLKHF